MILDPVRLQQGRGGGLFGCGSQAPRGSIGRGPFSKQPQESGWDSLRGRTKGNAAVFLLRHTLRSILEMTILQGASERTPLRLPLGQGETTKKSEIVNAGEGLDSPDQLVTHDFLLHVDMTRFHSQCVVLGGEVAEELSDIRPSRAETKARAEGSSWLHRPMRWKSRWQRRNQAAASDSQSSVDDIP